MRTSTEGAPEPLGLALDEGGANIAVAAARATSVMLCLFDARGERELERIALPARTGDVFHGHVAGVQEGARYGLRAAGPYDPARGDRYDPAKLLLDPYATAIDRPFRLDPAMMTAGAETAPVMPKAIATAAGPRPSAGRPRIAWAESVIYEAHVRGFTRLHPDIPEAIRGTFAALGHPAAIAHLSRLGITAVEVMPSAAWIDERHLGPLGLSNYWGYNPVAPMAPDPRLAPGGFAEIRQAVAALHAARIEMILDVVLNHTGEGDEWGPTLSLRGLDNRGYYRLLPADPARYVNDTGCGNTLALDRPGPLRLAMDALRLWASETGLDGFRFDLATTLGRRDAGFDAAAPLLSAIAQDPVLRDLKLIAEPWDIGPGGYQLGRFPPPWGEWNDRFRDAVRGFWRGEGGRVAELATRLAGSADLFRAHGRPSRSINAVTTHDGFTLADLVAYAERHNLANGEENRDGSADDRSWNNGVEGETADPAIRAARRQDQRSLALTLTAARGTPMLGMGSELGHSQRGNNNAYAQDNALSWLDWQSADMELIDFVRRAIAARRAHRALHADRFLDGAIRPDSELPDVAWLKANGTRMEAADWQNTENRTVIAVFAAAGAGGFDRVVVALHADGNATRVLLPEARAGFAWRLELDSAAPERTARDLEDIVLAPRSAVLVAEVREPAKERQEVPAGLLERLVQGAGIAPAWRDLQGERHLVGIETKRALLAAMGLPAGSRSEAEESLSRLSGQARRGLPETKVVRLGEPIALPLGREGDRCGGAVRITVRREDGGEEHLAAEGGEALLGPLPAGRHVVVRDDLPDSPCLLTIAPARCFLPAELAHGARRFGVAAHLYTLRRKGDQGIGDFTTLGAFAERAGAIGGAILGINPLHALFACERDRASPYHPSDRRFLDPIYLDVTALGPFGEAAGARALLAEHANEMAALSAAPLVDYGRVWALKRKVLEAAFAAFEHLEPARAPRRDVARFVAAGGESLRRFACFEAIAETRRGSWQDWPGELSGPHASGVARFAEREARRVGFHLFLQFLGDAQLARAAERGRDGGLSLGLYRDLAVGAAADGAEAWASEGALVRGAAIGAPPDRFAPDGQNWHLAPPDPLKPAAQSSFAGLLAANMRHAGALRIDHVMGLARLFWIPAGTGAKDGTYVSYPLDDLLGHLALESTRARSLVVGEDLGTVPEGLRARLNENAVLGCRVLWFERDGAGFRGPRDYPVQAVASVSTHDLPTLAGWWLGLDGQERVALGISSEDGSALRAAEKRALVEALAREGLLGGPVDLEAEPTPALLAAIHAYLARTPSMLALVQADDLAGATMAVNLPGTDRERPNWRRKLAPGIDRIFASETARAILAPLIGERGAQSPPDTVSAR